MVRVEERKLPQHNFLSERVGGIKRLYVSLSQHLGKPALPAVKRGQVVQQGQLIGSLQGRISANIHAPSSGKVVDVSFYFHPVLKRSLSVIIDCESSSPGYSPQNIDNMRREELIQLIREAGIVGMGGACFPTHIKLSPPKKIDTLIINGCECEPYLACDYRLMVEEGEKIFKGVEIISRIIEPSQVLFCLEENKPRAIKKFNLFLSTKKYNLPPSRLKVFKSYYPQGGEKQLIYNATGRKVPAGGLPFEVGCLVQNVATCFAIYEAVVLNKPLIERLVTFAGAALVEPKNLWVKLGTSIEDLFEAKILKFRKEPKKIIYGGPMMGIALDSLDYPILKGTSGILFLSEEEVDFQEERICIRCARCVDACPMRLAPLEYVKRVKLKEFERLREIFINDCIECGVCSFVCPAKIPIVHYIKVGKTYAISS